jgi:prefoldin subunit 5
MIGLKQQEVEKNAESAWEYVKNSKKQLPVETADGKQSLRKRLENFLGLTN